MVSCFVFKLWFVHSQCHTFWNRSCIIIKIISIKTWRMDWKLSIIQIFFYTTFENCEMRKGCNVLSHSVNFWRAFRFSLLVYCYLLNWNRATVVGGNMWWLHLRKSQMGIFSRNLICTMHKNHEFSLRRSIRKLHMFWNIVYNACFCIFHGS